MNIHYKVIEVWPNDHQIVVRYTTDLVSEEDVVLQRDENENIVRCRTDVPIVLPIPAPTGEALEKLIMNNAPVDFLRTKESVIDPEIETGDLSSLLNVSNTKVLEEDSYMTDEEIRRAVESVVVIRR
jgi:hypothetical protein